MRNFICKYSLFLLITASCSSTRIIPFDPDGSIVFETESFYTKGERELGPKFEEGFERQGDGNVAWSRPAVQLVSIVDINHSKLGSSIAHDLEEMVRFFSKVSTSLGYPFLRHYIQGDLQKNKIGSLTRALRTNPDDIVILFFSGECSINCIDNNATMKMPRNDFFKTKDVLNQVKDLNPRLIMTFTNCNNSVWPKKKFKPSEIQLLEKDFSVQYSDFKPLFLYKSGIFQYANKDCSEFSKTSPIGDPTLKEVLKKMEEYAQSGGTDFADFFENNNIRGTDLIDKGPDDSSAKKKNAEKDYPNNSPLCQIESFINELFAQLSNEEDYDYRIKRAKEIDFLFENSAIVTIEKGGKPIQQIPFEEFLVHSKVNFQITPFALQAIDTDKNCKIDQLNIKINYKTP